MKSLLFVALFCVCSFHPLASQASATLSLSKDKIQRQLEINNEIWLYREGWGDTSWAGKSIDEHTWMAKKGAAILYTKDLEELHWHGIGWFRVKLRIDSSLRNTSVAVFFRNNGAAEIYFDGKKHYSVGTVGRTAAEQRDERLMSTPLYFWLDSSAEHVLAVRYSNHDALNVNSSYHWFSAVPESVGFGATITTLDIALNIQQRIRYGGLIRPSLTGGFILSLGVLFFLLYLTQRREKAYLLYSLFAFLYSFSWIFNGTLLQFLINDNTLSVWRSIIFSCLAFDASLVLLPIFLFAVFEQRLPRVVWIIILLGTIDCFGQLIVRAWFEQWWRIFAVIAWLWSLYIVAKALKKQKHDAWFIAGGVGLYVATALIGSLQDILIYVTGTGLFTFDIFWLAAINATVGELSIPVAMALFLARRSARTNEMLAQKLEEVQMLSAETLRQGIERERLMLENERKTKELEEARELQLSMLPHTVPSVQGLEIAVFMRTATEVGGDYYDFMLHSDGSLRCVIGDATGHGMKAGTMVTIAKSLFHNLAADNEPINLLRRMNTGIREMRLRGIFMGLTAVNLTRKESRLYLRLSSAGMPPALVYRAETQRVESLVLKSPPLGAFAGFSFQELFTELDAGDVVLFVSDGLPERFNADNEQLGDERVIAQFQAICAERAGDEGISQNIVDALTALGDAWGGVRPQDDDITMIAFAMR